MTSTSRRVDRSPVSEKPAVEKPVEETVVERRPHAALVRARALLVAIGAPVVKFIEEAGRLGIFCAQVLFWLPRRPFRWAQLFRHMSDAGFGSLFIVVLTGFFTGLVFGIQQTEV